MYRDAEKRSMESYRQELAAKNTTATSEQAVPCALEVK